MVRRVITSALAIVLGVSLIAGCGGSSSTSPKSGNSNDSGGASGEKKIKIGLIAPMTGDVKTFGESTKNGFDLAIKQAGGKVGDFTIEKVYGDDKNDPNEGVSVANKMISSDKVQAIVGSVASKVSVPISEIANAAKIPMMTSASTAETVTVDAKGNVKPYVFRACFIDPFQGAVAAKFAAENLKLKTAAVMYDKANDYSTGLANQFKANFEKLGGKVIAMEAYSTTDTDFNAVVTNIAGKKPELLYLPDYYQKVSLIAKQAQSKGLTVPMMGGDGWDSSDLDYDTLAGNYFTNHYSAEDQRKEVQDFVSAYKAEYGKVPDALAELAYDATNILLAGIKTANSTDGTAIAKALEGMKDIPTVAGKINYDKLHNAVKSAVVLQVQKGKVQKYVATVNP